MKQHTFNDIVTMFLKEKDQHGRPLNMHSLLIKQKSQTYLHHFKDDKQPSDIRSISKTILTIVLGVISKKYPTITNETYIYPIIKNVINLTNKPNASKLQKVQIKHLLTHTIGYKDVLLMRNDIADMDPFEYLDYVVNYPIVYDPGEHYLYSNAGFYLLGVVLQEFLQEDLLVFMKREIFDPLGVDHFTWEKYGNYIAGATRLWLFPEDLRLFGELLLNNGKVREKQLISEDWVQTMTTKSHYTKAVDTPHATFRRYAYAHGLWIAKAPIYFGHGTDGQTLTIIPDKETIIITLADQPDVQPIEKVINQIIENELK